MHMWQLCHLAMVVPIADAYYEADCPERAGKDWKIMKKTARKLENENTRQITNQVEIQNDKSDDLDVNYAQSFLFGKEKQLE